MEAAWPEGLGDWTRPFNLFIPRSDQKECSPYFINALSKGKIIRNGRGGYVRRIEILIVKFLKSV